MMPRRSVYFFIKRSQLIPMMMLLDWPEHLVSIGQRSTTTTAPQALSFLNSDLARRCGEGLASRVTAKGDRGRFGRAGLPARLRPRTHGIRSPACRRFPRCPAIRLHPRRPSRSRRDLRSSIFCQAIIGMNEFIYIP